MMCDQVREQSLIEAYLTGRLPEQERDAFELHYLECDRCFVEVEAMRAVQGALRATPPVAPHAPVRRGFAKALWLLPVAAALAIGAIAIERVTRTPAPQVGQAPQPAANLYADLARFDPPPFTPSKLRAAPQPAESAFRQAMAGYSLRDWPACESALSAVAARYPQAVQARYYLGVCALLANHVIAGETALRNAIALGDTPYLEEAHFYLAKALLARGDALGARTELQRAIAMGGDLEPQAMALAARIH